MLFLHFVFYIQSSESWNDWWDLTDWDLAETYFYRTDYYFWNLYSIIGRAMYVSDINDAISDWSVLGDKWWLPPSPSPSPLLLINIATLNKRQSPKNIDLSVNQLIFKVCEGALHDLWKWKMAKCFVQEWQCQRSRIFWRIITHCLYNIPCCDLLDSYCMLMIYRFI